MIRVLFLLLPEEVAGDLVEEFSGTPLRLWSQAFRSVLALAYRSLSLQMLTAFAAIATMIAGDRLWSFVLSQVPLKCSGARGWEFWTLEILAGVAAAIVIETGKGRQHPR